jgi:hypothetical protein
VPAAKPATPSDDGLGPAWRILASGDQASIDRPPSGYSERLINLRFDPSSHHLGAEFVGQARVFRNRVIDEECQLSLCLEASLQPVRSRRRCKPTLRKDAFISLLRQWQHTYPKTYRLSSSVCGDAKYGFIIAGHYLRPGRWSTSQWCSEESGIVVSLIMLEWTPGSCREVGGNWCGSISGGMKLSCHAARSMP